MASTYELIASQTLGSSASSVTFSSIPGTYDDLVVVIASRSDRPSVAIDGIKIEPNASSGSASNRNLYAYNNAITSSTGTYIESGVSTTSATVADTFGNSEVYIPNYAGSTNKSFSSCGVCEHNSTAAGIYIAASLWANTSAITSLVFKPVSGTNFVTGSSFYLYGVTHA